MFEPNTSKILLGIELDDRSHERPDRQRRDEFVNKAMIKAGVSLLRIPTDWGYDMGKLDKDITLALKD